MKTRVLIDTGPVTAIFHRGDDRHGECVEQMKSLRAPLLTCWPVVTEAAWLLRSRPDAVAALLGAFDDGVFEMAELGPRAIEPIAKVLARYEDLRPQLADASLLYLAERESIGTIFTLDRRDFSVYRTKQNRSLSIVP